MLDLAAYAAALDKIRPLSATTIMATARRLRELGDGA